jgi:energy-coupling factor transporter ATP-binding protein EcfA2
MYISRFQVSNYKSFYESPVLQLGTGFNIITGQNNAGKTALLEALTLPFTSSPHRSIKTVPSKTARVNPVCKIELSFVVDAAEIRELLSTPGQYFIPFPRVRSQFAETIGCDSYGPPCAERLLNWMRSLSCLTFTLRLLHQANNGQWQITQVPSFGSYESDALDPANSHFALCTVGQDGTMKYMNTVQPNSIEVGVVFAERFLSRIYRFKAERLNIGSWPSGNNPTLAPDASNLAEVLNILQGNPARFARLNSLVQELFPAIRAVTVLPDAQEGTKQTIRVWNIDVDSEREDLTIPLSQGGTGLGQVLAMLYVVLTAETPRLIIIDEPQSFLHPGAIRKLIEILKSYCQQHQFIIATHSPTIITATGTPTILHVSLADGESRISVLNTNEAVHIREFLAEVGATLSDVFGADNILWVEGSTEEICFPKILAKLGKKHRSLMGTVIKGVITTGDLTAKIRAKLAWEVYQKLSNAIGLIPSAIGFIFDDEGRTKQEKRELRHLSGDLITFTKRQMYENYLLHVDAIASVMNAIEGFRGTPVQPSEIESWFNTNQSRFGSVAPGEPWQNHVDAGKLLKALFNELSETRVGYLKTRHSVAITD